MERGIIFVVYDQDVSLFRGPAIEERGDCVTVRFRRADYVPFKWQEAILTLLDGAESGLALREIVARLVPATNKRQVKRALVSLRHRGLAEPEPPREFQRPFCLSQAAMADPSNWR